MPAPRRLAIGSGAGWHSLLRLGDHHLRHVDHQDLRTILFGSRADRASGITAGWAGCPDMATGDWQSGRVAVLASSLALQDTRANQIERRYHPRWQPRRHHAPVGPPPQTPPSLTQRERICQHPHWMLHIRAYVHHGHSRLFCQSRCGRFGAVSRTRQVGPRGLAPPTAIDARPPSHLGTIMPPATSSTSAGAAGWSRLRTPTRSRPDVPGLDDRRRCGRPVSRRKARWP